MQAFMINLSALSLVPEYLSSALVYITYRANFLVGYTLIGHNRGIDTLHYAAPPRDKDSGGACCGW